MKINKIILNDYDCDDRFEQAELIIFKQFIEEEKIQEVINKGLEYEEGLDYLYNLLNTEIGIQEKINLGQVKEFDW